MSKSFFDTLKANSTEAVYRVAGVQVIKATKNGLLQVLRSKGIANKHVDKVSNLLDTEIGTAGLSTVVGLMLAHLPKFKNDELAQGIAKEFKVGGLALAGNLLAAKTIKEFLPSLGNTIESLPAIKDIPLLTPLRKIRVADQTTTEPVYEELEVPTFNHMELSHLSFDDFENS
jgi:hypothetical protein